MKRATSKSWAAYATAFRPRRQRLSFADMESFAQYAFNKSHAAAYAVVAYETGYLKKFYPVEFMAALMTSVMGDAKYISRYIRNCQDMGIEVLPPCINESQKKVFCSRWKKSDLDFSV